MLWTFHCKQAHEKAIIPKELLTQPDSPTLSVYLRFQEKVKQENDL